MADALSHQKDDVADIVGLHALVSRMRLVSSLDVVEAAEQIILGIIATYQGPNLALHEMHEYVRQGRMNFWCSSARRPAPTWRAAEPEASALDASEV